MKGLFEIVLGSGPRYSVQGLGLDSEPWCSVHGKGAQFGDRGSIQGPGSRYESWGAKECLLGTEFQKSPMEERNLLPFTRPRPRGYLGRVKKWCPIFISGTFGKNDRSATWLAMFYEKNFHLGMMSSSP